MGVSCLPINKEGQIFYWGNLTKKIGDHHHFSKEVIPKGKENLVWFL
jgi:hypothetical protein